MRRRALATAALATTLLLTACGGAGSDHDGAGSSTEAGGDGQGLEGTLTVFAAASLGEAFDDLLASFGAEHPDVTVSPAIYDGSSTLVTQLVEGADADVLATADQATMTRLVESDLPVGEPADFATNALVIAVPAGNPLGIEDLTDLEGLAYATCAPEVPCGAAAGRLFEAHGLTPDAVSQEQNVTAVTQRVVSGEVDAGLVYTTDITGRAGELEVVEPSGEPIVNVYPIITLTDSPVAAAFRDYVLSDAGQAVLADYGFGEP